MSVQLNNSLWDLVLNEKLIFDSSTEPEIRTEEEVKKLADLLKKGADPKKDNLLARHLVSQYPINLSERRQKISLIFAKMLIEAGAEFDAKQYAEMQTVAKQYKELLKNDQFGYKKILSSINVLEKSSNPFLVALDRCFWLCGYHCLDPSKQDATNAEKRLDSALLRYELWAKELASVKPAKK